MEKQSEDRLKDQKASLEKQHESKLTELIAEHESKVKKLEEKLKSKQADLKKAKADLEKATSTVDDKIKKINSVHEVEVQQLKADHKTEIEAQATKTKQAVKAAIEKEKASNRNAVDQVKNEMHKKVIDVERDKKKEITRLEQEKDQLKQEMEEKFKEDIKDITSKAESTKRKALEQAKKDFNSKLDQRDVEVQDFKLQFVHEVEEEQKMLEARLKESLTIELRSALRQSMAADFDQQVQNLKESHMKELSTFRPASTAVAETQTHTAEEEDLLLSQQNLSQSSALIEQVKKNFTEEMERQQQVFEVQLKQRQVSSVRIFAEVLVMELEKIMGSIESRIGGSDAEQKRKEANEMIERILSRNDIDDQMKTSLDGIKRKLSDMLRNFKQAVENKLEKKWKAAKELNN